MGHKLNSDKDQQEDAVLRRLNALIAFSLNPIVTAKIYEKAARLKALNFTNSEIAKILGKTETHIRKELSIGKKVKAYGRKGDRTKA